MPTFCSTKVIHFFSITIHLTLKRYYLGEKHAIMLYRCDISALLTSFPLSFIAFRLLLPTFRQRACITVLPPLCRMPQCHRQVIALLVARTVRHRLLTWLETGLTFPTAAACRGFDASACTPTPRDLLSSHWQLRLHVMEGSQPFVYKCAPRGTRTGSWFFSSLLISHDLCNRSRGDTWVTAGRNPAAVPRQKRNRDLSPAPSQ